MFEGTSVIVTGGNRGIGLGIVTFFAEQGAKVYSTYRSNPEQAHALQNEFLAKGQSVTFLKADVTNAVDCQNLVDAVIEAQGKIDILVNNAGITRDNLIMRMSEKDWTDVIDANLKSVFLMCKAVTRPMMSKRSGRIINISSIVGLSGNAGQVNYSASKAGVIAVTQSLAKELASRNILVNCVAPGFIETDMTGKLNEEQKANYAQQIPLKRSGSAREIATAVGFFASEAASYVTGQVLCVDGGLHI